MALAPGGAAGSSQRVRPVSLQAYQEELKRLIFFGEKEAAESVLWGAAIPGRLQVYRNNTRTNWTDTLDHDFALTRKQFDAPDWQALRQRFFTKHPPQHWELNASMAPFPKFLEAQRLKKFVKELADYEWQDLKIFIDRAGVHKDLGVTNPTAVVSVYQHQIFYWVEAGAPPDKPPRQKPEALVFYRDSRNTCHIQEADPLMLLFMEHFRKPGAKLDDLEAVRRRLLPTNHIPLDDVLASLKKSELILL